MIPVNLTLSNFTSFGENVPELDFTKFHLAVISGSNGVGKSSLLDAITWCLWGWSRAGDNSDQLVRLGTNQMWVEFSFDLDGNIYTVKRKRILKGGGSTTLELWSNSHNLTEGTIKATQQKIINLLHLTIETFTNSSFLRQGHADEFTTKGPNDRKRILADILGLDHYDILEEKAKEKVKAIQTKLQLLEYQFLEIESELSQKEEREKALNLALDEAKKVEQELKEIEKLIKQIDEEKQTISITIKSLEEKRNQILFIKKELLDLKLQIDLKEKAKEEFQVILNQKEDIEKNYQFSQTLQEQKKVLENKRNELIKVKDQLVLVQKTLVEREQKRSQAIQTLKIDIKKYDTENEQLQNQINHLTEHKNLCPTCGQNIEEAKNKEIILTNKKQLKENLEKLGELKIKIQKYTEIILPEQKQADELNKEIVKLEEETKELNEISQKINELEKYSNLYLKLQQAQASLKSHLEAISDLQKIYGAKLKQISESEKELGELSLYEIKLQETKNNLQAKESIKQQLSQKALELRGTVGETKQLVARTEQLETVYKQKSEEKHILSKEKDIYTELSLAFGKKGIQAMIIETAIPEIEEEANNLLKSLSNGRMSTRFETQKETKTKREDGEKGIVETLDIIISDEMGERPYEMYSGGEAFRVNLSIRLALSKLLTRRAGAKLQFLVIDEGFGTQDADGISKIVDVLDTIKNDFEKIVIITHLDELKEEFPVRIEVSKNSIGSTFELIGN